MKHFPEKIQLLEKFSEHFDAYRLQTDKVDIYFAEYPAGKKIEPHSHDSENFGLVTLGCLELAAEGKTRNYRAGEWYHLPANTEHAATFAEDTAIIELWFKL